MNFCCPNCEQPIRLIGPGLWWIVGPSERLVVGEKTGPNPTDRHKPGSKHHVITDARGIPLAVILTGANRHDVTQLLPLVEAIPSIRGRRGSGIPWEMLPKEMECGSGMTCWRRLRDWQEAGVWPKPS